MSETDAPRYAPEWLALREGADAAARAAELLDPLREHLADQVDPAAPMNPAGPARRDAGLTIRDLGCGSGSMGRWLAPRLNGPQHWILHDHDPGLLALAAAQMPRTAADGSRVTVTTERGDITRLTADGLTGTSLVTASALLDLLTRDELDALAAACAVAGCPALLALSVAGRVGLTPADPLDAEIADAFNAHQRRVDHGRRLLGPDAATAASDAFARHGLTVQVQASPWRLGADESALTAEWLRGWVGAARDQRPDLAPDADSYLQRRLAACEAGELRAVVHHSDVLALPGPTGGTA
ncbi:class I SAM-dependent methyltransferase [Streptomyces sp. NBC_01142]|uniref:class I SAM-dependent methyltransferase n=1 Tax=Streptomyces sp. NBC_01142 TaxID=2975865 RepID=UPI002258156F|nr:class I SAM-dependent methyltransferase [Streptomyces sp. NBC_01142]MCX4825619.1 class I SAM-dependent methyltransferase [Streptomyces sp. NBC_01142]